MNTFGQLFRITIYGESHGKGVGVIMDGCPVGIEIKEEDFLDALSRRRSGKIGTTPRVEKDFPNILSGVFDGYSTGAPINIFFENTNTNSKDYNEFRDVPRPGHSDYAADIKYKGYNDIRGGGTFSGRMTLGLVAAGVLAQKIILKNDINIEVKTQIKNVGKLKLNYDSFGMLKNSEEFEGYLKKIKIEENSVGGIIECVAKNIPTSLGEPYFDSFESVLSHLIFSVGGVRGIEFGMGFEMSYIKGSESNDPIINSEGKTLTNNCGGINGGISNGNEIVFRVAVKPTSSISKMQKTFSFKEDKMIDFSIKGRHDTAFVLRVPVVIESCLLIVLADFVLRSKINNK